MSRALFDVVVEPRGEVLAQLMRALQRLASGVTLVVHDDFELAESAVTLLARLDPYLVERKRTESWPGTTLLDATASVLRFRFCEAVLEDLIAAANGLYDWIQPSLPEDLALLREDGTAILGSICHEADAFLQLSDEEYEAMSVAVPQLATIVIRRAELGSTTGDKNGSG